MKKDNKVDNKKSSFPTIRYKDISEIDRKVDRILLENKNKLNDVELEELDVKKFSPKNKDGKTIYYIREKSKKNTEDDKDSKILSEEIISDINKESEAEFPKTNENVEKTDEKPKKGKRQIVFGKKEEKQVKKEEPEEEKPVKPSEYKEMLSGIDKPIEGKKPVSSDKETPPPETIKADEGTVKNKDTERPSHPPDLSEFRKKYEAHLTLPEPETPETETKEGENNNFTKTKKELEETKKIIEKKKKELEMAEKQAKVKEEELKRKKKEKLEKEKELEERRIESLKKKKEEEHLKKLELKKAKKEAEIKERELKKEKILEARKAIKEGKLKRKLLEKEKKKNRVKQEKKSKDKEKKEETKEKPVSSDEDLIKVLKIADDLLEKLSDDVIDEFVQSEDFELYEKVINKYKIK